MTGPVVSEAPMRLTLAGGGTDLPEVYRFGPTSVIAVTVDLTVRVAVADTRVAAASAADAGFESPRYTRDLDGADPDPYLRAARTLLGTGTQWHMAIRSQVLPGSGLGGSGAFCATLLDALARYHQRELTPGAVAELAFSLERRLLGRPVGKQDAWVCAAGGAVRLRLSRHGQARVTSHPALFAALDRMLGTGLSLWALPDQRDAGRVLAAAGAATAQYRVNALRAAAVAEQAFLSGDPVTVGRMLRDHWVEKVRHNPAVDHRLCRAVTVVAPEVGIHGFKLLGAGGGGHMLVALDPTRRSEAARTLSGLGLTPVVSRPVDRGLAALAISGDSIIATGREVTCG